MRGAKETVIHCSPNGQPKKKARRSGPFHMSGRGGLSPTNLPARTPMVGQEGKSRQPTHSTTFPTPEKMNARGCGRLDLSSG